MASTRIRIGIVGGGIGGLTLALALRRRGLVADVYEQASELREIGAAVALSANANRELERLGLLPAIAAYACEPSELIWRGGADGHRVASFPVALDGGYRARFGAPYFGIHRADLQQVLAGAHGSQGLHLGHRLVAVEQRGDGAVRLEFANGRSSEVDVLIGADGVRSTVRAHVAGEERAEYSGTSAFRGIVPVRDVPSLPDPRALQFWMGPGAHLLHYPIGPEADVNFFAVVEGPARWTHDSWTAPTESVAAANAFAGWHPAVVEMVTAVPHRVLWGLFTVRPLKTWRRGRTVLIGDAAHGMLPHHGQGANVTIEDAITLVELLPVNDMELFDAAMAEYERLRRTRTRIIQRSARATNAVLHLPDHAIAGRAAYLARFPERFGWIHAFDALADVRKHALRRER